MQNNTSKMVSLLGKIRKQMNGAVLDTFRYYGAKYGMNYGVAIHSIRDMAVEVGTDHDLAKFLYRQQVRELQIIALWIADAEQLTGSELDFWREGIVNSELAEQAAQGLLCNVEDIDSLVTAWCRGENSLVAYAALLAAARNKNISDSAIQTSVVEVVTLNPNNHLVAQGAVALLASVIASNRELVASILEQLPENSTAQLVVDEIKWRLEFGC
ncbi:MAG: DNA alkylation repair enzyme [Rikenellaceae bacterium]|nr:DNA alkylation repair enzyme [Rikenellaceae bacterium]